MNTTPYTDPPEVLADAAVLEALPDWYLALMLARLLNRKTPARSTEISRRTANLNGQGCEATANRDGGESGHAGTLAERIRRL